MNELYTSFIALRPPSNEGRRILRCNIRFKKKNWHNFSFPGLVGGDHSGDKVASCSNCAGDVLDEVSHVMFMKAVDGDQVMCLMCRSAATGAGAGDKDAANPVEAVLPRREAKPPRQVHQGRGGQYLPLNDTYFAYCHRLRS